MGWLLPRECSVSFFFETLRVLGDGRQEGGREDGYAALATFCPGLFYRCLGGIEVRTLLTSFKTGVNTRKRVSSPRSRSYNLAWCYVIYRRELREIPCIDMNEKSQTSQI